MFDPKFKNQNIILIILLSFYRIFIFFFISTFILLILKTFVNPFDILGMVVAILFAPFFLAILCFFYYFAKLLDKIIYTFNNKILYFISVNIIPVIFYILMEPTISYLYEGPRFLYYTSIPLSFLTMFIFDVIIKFLEKSGNMAKLENRFKFLNSHNNKIIKLENQYRDAISNGNYDLANSFAIQIYNNRNNLNISSKSILAQYFAGRFINADKDNISSLEERFVFAMQWLEKAQIDAMLIIDRKERFARFSNIYKQMSNLYKTRGDLKNYKKFKEKVDKFNKYAK